jgi:transcriptional regulator with XRE-family HTH domain/tetratricopeptide (TPR) repeat protein
MRVALAKRDISEVYRLLGRAGVSQRQIAALTGQNQSEISDISQGRQVQAYDLLARIADGLGIPRGYMGLAYTDTTAACVASAADTTTQPEVVWMERRTFLGMVSKIVMGATLTAAELDLIAATPRGTPVPRRIGDAEVAQVRAVTAALRTHDAAHGGGSCRDAILAHTRWAESLRAAACPDEVQPQLLTAVAEAKTLAGWTAHDLGLAMEARQHLTQALQTTQQAGAPAHSAIVLFSLGRVPLDNGDPVEALKLFQLGQIAAQDSRSATPVAFLLANEAVAYAQLGDARQAMTALRRAQDEYAHAGDEDQQPEYLRMFDQVALTTAAGRVYSNLGLSNARYRELAITHLNGVLVDDNGRGRQRAFNQAWLATCLLADGDPAGGARLGNRVLDAARDLTSPRLLRALSPLQAEADRDQRHGDVHQLARDLQRLQTSA